MIRAIETQYKGYRFRSRLEARWAVFLDHVKMKWEYEPEGLVVGRLKWLPDFWLECGHWGEVKGHLDADELTRLLSLAAGVSECGKGDDVVVLGHIPDRGATRWPVQLHNHGQLWAVPWNPAKECPIPCPAIPREKITARLLLDGFPAKCPDWALAPLDSARRARFEWGESG